MASGRTKPRRQGLRASGVSSTAPSSDARSSDRGGWASTRRRPASRLQRSQRARGMADRGGTKDHRGRAAEPRYPEPRRASADRRRGWAAPPLWGGRPARAPPQGCERWGAGRRLWPPAWLIRPLVPPPCRAYHEEHSPASPRRRGSLLRYLCRSAGHAVLILLPELLPERHRSRPCASVQIRSPARRYQIVADEGARARTIEAELQNRCTAASAVVGGFDSHAPPPGPDQIGRDPQQDCKCPARRGSGRGIGASGRRCRAACRTPGRSRPRRRRAPGRATSAGRRSDGRACRWGDSPP